jgi:hypothetical protein
VSPIFWDLQGQPKPSLPSSNEQGAVLEPLLVERLRAASYPAKRARVSEVFKSDKLHGVFK